MAKSWRRNREPSSSAESVIGRRRSTAANGPSAQLAALSSCLPDHQRDEIFGSNEHSLAEGGDRCPVLAHA